MSASGSDVGERLTGHQMAAEMTKAFGEPCAIQPRVIQSNRNLGFPDADDLGNCFNISTIVNTDFVAHGL